MTVTATKRRQKVSESHHETMVNNEPRLLEVFDVGSVSHQGDLIIVRINKLPQSAKPRGNRQLADGNTQGSRHFLDRGTPYDADPKEVVEEIWQATGKFGVKQKIDQRYVGPVFVSPEQPTARDLRHPEHGDQGFPAGAVCAVVYQRNMDAEEREQRVLD